ncbi:MAG: alkaline phosphatase family protein [Gemmatimonadota bacterium]
MAGTGRILMIGLDAADSGLVDRWIDDGTLPNLRALRGRGLRARLKTTARDLAGSPWPSFYTGTHPGQHGIYHDYQWRHERMRYAAPSEEWLPARPFWRNLESPLRTLAYDVPLVFSCEPFPGWEIAGWATHDAPVPPSSHPPELLEEVRREFGAWPVPPESYGPSTIDELLALERLLEENTQRSCQLALSLLDRPWNLALVVFSALHRGGHRLMDRTSVRGPIPPEMGERFDGALKGLYQACDTAVGELVEAAGDATVLVFALHGMMPNPSRVDLLPGMLHGVLNEGDSTAPRAGLLRRAGEALPLGVRRFLTRRVPGRLQDRVMSRWATGGLDWNETEAFTLRADLQGYVRVNLRGREAEGIVDPGARLDRLLERITEGLLSFRDGSTGEALIEDVERTARLYPDGARADRLPDLIVRWKETPAGMHEAVSSPRFGTVRRSTPGGIPNARSGNHRGEGWLIAAGPDVPRGARLRESAHILDLAPTVLERLGARPAGTMTGRPIRELLGVPA